MTHTIDTILALADALGRANGCGEGIDEARNALHVALVEALAPTIKQTLTVHASAEEYLQYRYGAYRGHFAWRELEEAYSQGRYDEAMLQGPNPWPDDEPEIQCGIFCEAAQRELTA